MIGYRDVDIMAVNTAGVSAAITSSLIDNK